MRKRTTVHMLVVLLAVGLLAAMVAPAQAGKPSGGPYEVIDTQVLIADPPHSQAFALSESGRAVGTLWYIDEMRGEAFGWKDGDLTILTRIGDNADASDVNESDSVVGCTGGTANSPDHPALWKLNPNGTVDVILLDESDNYGCAYGINDDGMVVGHIGGRAFSWTEAGGMVDLHEYIGGDRSYLNAVNNDGDAVGYRGTTDGYYEAIVLTSDGMLHELGPLDETFVDTRAIDISNFGQVVGVSDSADGLQRAFRWSIASGMEDLGLGGALGINDDGHVTGYTSTDRGNRACIWTETGGMMQLGRNGGAGRDISNAVDGVVQVVGSHGRKKSWEHRATLWTVDLEPEPNGGGGKPPKPPKKNK